MGPGLARILAQNWGPSTLRGMKRKNWWGRHIKPKADWAWHDIACECQTCMNQKQQLKKMKQDVDQLKKEEQQKKEQHQQMDQQMCKNIMDQQMDQQKNGQQHQWMDQLHQRMCECHLCMNLREQLQKTKQNIDQFKKDMRQQLSDGQKCIDLIEEETTMSKQKLEKVNKMADQYVTNMKCQCNECQGIKLKLRFLVDRLKDNEALMFGEDDLLTYDPYWLYSDYDKIEAA